MQLFFSLHSEMHSYVVGEEYEKIGTQFDGKCFTEFVTNYVFVVCCLYIRSKLASKQPSQKAIANAVRMTISLRDDSFYRRSHWTHTDMYHEYEERFYQNWHRSILVALMQIQAPRVATRHAAHVFGSRRWRSYVSRRRLPRLQQTSAASPTHAFQLIRSPAALRWAFPSAFRASRLPSGPKNRMLFPLVIAANAVRFQVFKRSSSPTRRLFSHYCRTWIGTDSRGTPWVSLLKLYSFMHMLFTTFTETVLGGLSVCGNNFVEKKTCRR